MYVSVYLSVFVCVHVCGGWWLAQGKSTGGSMDAIYASSGSFTNGRPQTVTHVGCGTRGLFSILSA